MPISRNRKVLCIYKGCKNGDDYQGPLHVLPAYQKDRLKQWLINCGAEELYEINPGSLTYRYRVCANHFDPIAFSKAHKGWRKRRTIPPPIPWKCIEGNSNANDHKSIAGQHTCNFSECRGLLFSSIIDLVAHKIQCHYPKIMPEVNDNDNTSTNQQSTVEIRTNISANSPSTPACSSSGLIIINNNSTASVEQQQGPVHSNGVPPSQQSPDVPSGEINVPPLQFQVTPFFPSAAGTQSNVPVPMVWLVYPSNVDYLPPISFTMLVQNGGSTYDINFCAPPVDPAVSHQTFDDEFNSTSDSQQYNVSASRKRKYIDALTGNNTVNEIVVDEPNVENEEQDQSVIAEVKNTSCIVLQNRNNATKYLKSSPLTMDPLQLTHQTPDEFNPMCDVSSTPPRYNLRPNALLKNNPKKVSRVSSSDHRKTDGLLKPNTSNQGIPMRKTCVENGEQSQLMAEKVEYFPKNASLFNSEFSRKKKNSSIRSPIKSATPKKYFKCNLCPEQYPEMNAEDLTLHKQVYHNKDNVSTPHDTLVTSSALGMPVVDLNCRKTLIQLLNSGIENYLCLSQCNNKSTHCYGIPIINTANSTGPSSQLLNTSALLNIGSLKCLSNSNVSN